MMNKTFREGFEKIAKAQRIKSGVEFLESIARKRAAHHAKPSYLKEITKAQPKPKPAPRPTQAKAEPVADYSSHAKERMKKLTPDHEFKRALRDSDLPKPTKQKRKLF